MVCKLRTFSIMLQTTGIQYNSRQWWWWRWGIRTGPSALNVYTLTVCFWSSDADHMLLIFYFSEVEHAFCGWILYVGPICYIYILVPDIDDDFFIGFISYIRFHSIRIDCASVRPSVPFGPASPSSSIGVVCWFCV